MFNRFLKGLGFAALALMVAAIGVWGTLLLEYAGPRSDLLRTTLVVGFALAAVATLATLFVRRWRRSAPICTGFRCTPLGRISSSIIFS
jgi:hypothetical protein